MKRYTDLTKDELADLTDEDLQRYIDIEIAYAGITPVIEPVPVPDFDPGIKPKVKAYEVCGIVVKDIKDAQTIAGMKTYSADYDYYGSGSNYKYLTERYNRDEIKTIYFYEKDDVTRIKAQLKDRKDTVDHYNEMKGDWDKYQEKTSSCRSEVMTAYREAVHYQRRVEHGKQQYERYLKLAEGETSIANRFFSDAFKDDQEMLDAILPRVASGVSVAEEAVVEPAKTDENA